MTKKKVSEIIEDERYATPKEYIELVSRSDMVYTMWGIDALQLTEKDIEDMRAGKCIWFTDGEYATILYMKGEDKV